MNGMRLARPGRLVRICAAVLAIVGAAPGMASAAPRAWVEMAPAGGSVVRVVTDAAACPVLRVDGRDRPMAERAAPAVLPIRSNKAHVTSPASFATRVCELRLARSVRRAIFGAKRLPLPSAHIDRIVVIGDTGCRLKDADRAWQGCKDPAQWPFAAIAARAAALHPDMVLHVGDYLYRENPCPQQEAACAQTPWGYGEAGWSADFLDPAAPLLAAAPWIMVRGNHEECARAGQGWWRLLDPHPLAAHRDCVDPADDAAGNHAEPYRVALGGGAQLVIADQMTLAGAGHGDALAAATQRADNATIARLARGARTTFLAAHYPVNPVLWAAGGTSAVTVGAPPVSDHAPVPLPVRAMFAGHIHLFQFARFASLPTQVITGFSGTLEDPVLAPASLGDVAGKPGAAAIAALTTITGRFGHALLTRRGNGWRLTVFGLDGAVIGRFRL